MKREVYDGNAYCVVEDMHGKHVLDIGANIGTFARLCIDRGAKVFCAEPSIENWETLKANCGFHFYGRRCAVTNRCGNTTLYTCQNPTAYSVLREPWHDTGEVVPSLTLASIVEEAMSFWGTFSIDLCKIDVEGAEYLIVPGYDFAPVRELAIEFHGCFVADAIDHAQRNRRRLAGLGFRELEWRTVDHPNGGWLRLYRGTKE